MSVPQSSNVENYTFMFNENTTTGFGIGSNAKVGNATFNLFKEDDKKFEKPIGNIMFTTNSRDIEKLYYQNVFVEYI